MAPSIENIGLLVMEAYKKEKMDNFTRARKKMKHDKKGRIMYNSPQKALTQARLLGHCTVEKVDVLEAVGKRGIKKLITYYCIVPQN